MVFSAKRPDVAISPVRICTTPQRRRQGVDGFRKVARDVTHISQMQLGDELLTRLGQKPGGNAEPETPPDFGSTPAATC